MLFPNFFRVYWVRPEQSNPLDGEDPPHTYRTPLYLAPCFTIFVPDDTVVVDFTATGAAIFVDATGVFACALDVASGENARAAASRSPAILLFMTALRTLTRLGDGLG
jgi:hypothetical protein